MYSNYHILNYNKNSSVFHLMLSIDQTKICVKGFPEIFTMKINCGGFFTNKTGRKYMDRRVTSVDNVDIKELCINELKIMLEGVGYDSHEPLFFYFFMLGVPLGFGVVSLINAQHLVTLSIYIVDCKEIMVYTEHGRSRLHSDDASP